MDLSVSATVAEVIALLSNLGVSHALLQQVKSSIAPPSVSKSKSIGPEKQLQILAGKVNVLEQQLAKLEQTRTRLVSELDVCHSQFADKNSQLEELRVQYRELRDTGRFTPTRTSPAHSAAVSVSGDDVQRDVTFANAGLGSGEGGTESLNAERNAHNASVPMGECPPPARAAPGRASKRGCVEATACPPSVEAVSSGRWHKTAEQCRSLTSVLNGRLTGFW